MLEVRDEHPRRRHPLVNVSIAYESEGRASARLPAAVRRPGAARAIAPDADRRRSLVARRAIQTAVFGENYRFGSNNQTASKLLILTALSTRQVLAPSTDVEMRVAARDRYQYRDYAAASCRSS